MMTVGLVVPCFNEADRWSEGYWREMTALPDTRWLFVDDGSTDATPRILRDLANATAHRNLRLDRNRGKSEAVRRGMVTLAHAEPDLTAIGFLDADGAFTTHDVGRLTKTFTELVTEQAAFDTVWSSRVALAGRRIDRSSLRHYVGRMVATALSLGWPNIPYDTQSGFKLFSPSNAFLTALGEPMQTRWFVDMELLIRWTEACGRPIRVWEEPLSSWRDVGGSKVDRRQFARIARELRYIKMRQAGVLRNID